MVMAYLREFGKHMGKEVGREFDNKFGVQVSSKLHEKTKKKLEMEKNKIYCLMVTHYVVLDFVFHSCQVHVILVYQMIL